MQLRHDWCYIYVPNTVMSNLTNHFAWIINHVVLSNRKQSEVPSKSEKIGRCVFLVKLNDCFGVSVYSRALHFFADTE